MSDTSGQQQAPAPSPPGASSSDDRTMAMLCHLAGLVGFLGPLIVWLIKKDQSPLVNDQGKESLNFQITILIALVISGVLMIVFIGFLLFPLVWLADLILIIVAAVKANSGVVYRYPFALRLIK
ncbi:MAG: DUF4870 domain-containing protein [Planctomycetes bacterium]|nr:DUF4870 domain-containing protein [Planctomycetota bacterium]